MAITYVNSGTEVAALSTNVTLVAPATPAVGDIWIALLNSRDTVTHVLSGWTQVFQEDYHEFGRWSAWWHRYAGSVPNLIVTHSGGDVIHGGIAAFRGCVVTGSPINMLGPRQTGADTSMEILGINPTAPDCMLLLLDVTISGTSRTLPSGFAAAFEDAAAGVDNAFKTTTGLDAGTGLQYKIHTYGPTSDLLETQTANFSWATVLVALAPPYTIRYHPRNGNAGRVIGGIFEGSDGDPHAGPYTMIYTIPDFGPVGQWYYANGDVGTWRYLRYRGPSNSYCNIAEVEFYRGGAKLTGTIYGTPGSWDNQGNTCDKAMDGDTFTHFDSPEEFKSEAYVGLDTGVAAPIPGHPSSRRFGGVPHARAGGGHHATW